jgi:hypothetical protein
VGRVRISPYIVLAVVFWTLQPQRSNAACNWSALQNRASELAERLVPWLLGDSPLTFTSRVTGTIPACDGGLSFGGSATAVEPILVQRLHQPLLVSAHDLGIPAHIVAIGSGDLAPIFFQWVSGGASGGAGELWSRSASSILDRSDWPADYSRKHWYRQEVWGADKRIHLRFDGQQDNVFRILIWRRQESFPIVVIAHSDSLEFAVVGE